MRVRRAIFFREQAQHAHAIVDLRVVLIRLVLRQFPARKQIKLIRWKDEARIRLPKAFLAPAVRNRQHRTRLFRCKRAQRS